MLVLFLIPLVAALDNYVTNGSHIDELKYREVFLFEVNEQRHNIVIIKATNESVKIRISPEMLDLTFNESEAKEIDLDNDGSNDFKIYLSKTIKYGGRFIFTILNETKSIELPSGGSGGHFIETQTEIPIETPTEELVEEIEEEFPPASKELSNLGTWEITAIALTFLIVVFLIILILFYQKNKNPEKEGG